MPSQPDRRSANHRLKEAVARQNSPYALLERFFAFVFKGLVYPQIWEDPKVERLGDESKRSEPPPQKPSLVPDDGR